MIHRSAQPAEPAPIELPHVVATVAADGTLTATVDGTPHPQPPAGAWTRATFGSLMDEITKDRTITVRVEVRESDGGVFTDIIHAHKQHPPARAAEPTAETRRGRRALAPRTPRLVEIHGDGFVAGEDVAVAVIVSHTDAAHTGVVRALVDLDDYPASASGEVLLVGRVSGMMIVERLQ